MLASGSEMLRTIYGKIFYGILEKLNANSLS